MKTHIQNFFGALALLIGIYQADAQTTPKLSLSVTASILPSGDQSFILHGNGPAGTNVVLEYTTNLTTPNWTTLSFFTLSGQIEEAYDVFNTDPSRYYRLNASDTIFTNPMFQGVIRYAGTYPTPTNISYAGIDGTPYTAVDAYPGWLELIANPYFGVSYITNSIKSVGGTIMSAMPAAGLYWVQVTNGTESVVLSNLFNQYWVIDGFPATSAVFGSANTLINVLDWNDPHGGNGVCLDDHMSNVAQIAGRRRPFDIQGANNPQMFDVHDRTPTLPAEVLLRMRKAYDAKERVTINLSLQSPASGEAISGDKSGNPFWNDIREAQFTFFETLLQMLEETSINQPGLADNTLISIIAGNAGVDLDDELSDLNSLYPDAFARVLIVGGTDTSGNIYPSFNHLDDNTVQNMVYARAQNVSGCSGTSFAAPEVASVLDAIWSQATNKTSAQVLTAFHQVLSQTGTNNIIPADSTGKVTTNFINQVVTLLNSTETYVGTAMYNYANSTSSFDTPCTVTPNPYVVTSTKSSYPVTLIIYGSLLAPQPFTGTCIPILNSDRIVYPAFEECNESEPGFSEPGNGSAQTSVTGVGDSSSPTITWGNGYFPPDNSTNIWTEIQDNPFNATTTTTIAVQPGTGTVTLKIHYVSTGYSANGGGFDASPSTDSTTIDATLIRQ